LHNNQVDLKSALNIAVQIAQALSAAHNAGIIHRDIKPENIMLRKDGIVKVLDFGLAKLTEQKRESVSNEASTLIRLETDSGVVIGTAQYMSPEQARGVRVDARTDVWSLGAMLYEMITKQSPFAGETQADTLVSILEREPKPISESAPNAPEELQRIIRKALKKDVEERYQSAKDLLIDLKLLQKEIELTAHTHHLLGKEHTDIDKTKHMAETVRLTATTGESVAVSADSNAVTALENKISRKKIGLLFVSLLIIGSIVFLYASRNYILWGFGFFAKDSGEKVSNSPAKQSLYLKMTEEEKTAFVKQQSQRISEMLGKNPTPLRDNAVRTIKDFVDFYARRSQSSSDKLWDESLHIIYSRALQYSPTIIKAFNKQGVPPILGLYIPMVESEYIACYENEIGSKGMFQFIASTAEAYGVNDRCDVRQVAPAAARYLGDRIAEFGHDADSMTLALMSYNRSPDSVRRDMRMLHSLGNKERSFWVLLDNADNMDEYFREETVKYVPKFFAAAIVGENPQTFGLPIPPLSTLGENKK
jgi:serine/threonine protein kinase